MNGLKPAELNHVEQQKAGSNDEHPGQDRKNFFVLCELWFKRKCINNKGKSGHQIQG